MRYCLAYSIIGVRVDVGRLQVSKKVRGCEHPLYNEESLFCGTCGAKAWIYKTVPIEGFNYRGCSRHGDISGFLVLTVGYSFICGRITSVSDNSAESSKVMKISDIDSIKNDMQLNLTPLGLWDEDSFGVWTVMEEGG